MPTPSYIVVKYFPSFKRASMYLVTYIDTGLGDRGSMPLKISRLKGHSITHQPLMD
jgi:hypothetical protein